MRAVLLIFASVIAAAYEILNIVIYILNILIQTYYNLLFGLSVFGV